MHELCCDIKIKSWTLNKSCILVYLTTFEALLEWMNEWTCRICFALVPTFFPPTEFLNYPRNGNSKNYWIFHKVQNISDTKQGCELTNSSWWGGPNLPHSRGINEQPMTVLPRGGHKCMQPTNQATNWNHV